MNFQKTIGANEAGSAVIALNKAISGEIDARGFKHLWIRMPAAWTAADIALHTSEESGGTFTLLRDNGATAVLLDGVLKDDCYMDINILAGVRFFKFASVDAADPTSGINQAAARTIIYALES